MLRLTHLFQALSAIAAAALLVTPSVHAQTSGASGDKSTAVVKEKSPGKLTEDEHEMMQDLAHANLAEIETGKMALEKSQNAEVKKFAQKMIDDHTKSMKELQKLAQSKGATLPTETDVQHRTIATALKALSGDTFDSQYISRVGVGDHERTVELLQKTQKEAKDADLKGYAQKTLKTVQQHLAEGKKLEQKMEKKQ